MSRGHRALFAAPRALALSACLGVCALLGLACEASPADTNSTTSSASETTAAPPERECFVCAQQRSCVMLECAEVVSGCYGADYFGGENGGECAEVLACLETCSCLDDACESGCLADASPACLSCTTQVRQCEQGMCDAATSCPDASGN